MEKLGKKLKHDHTLTSILKFAIFSVIMLAPIFSVLSKCMYTIINKNAYLSYQEEYRKESLYGNNTQIENTTTQWYYIDDTYKLKVASSTQTSRKYIDLEYEKYYLFIMNTQETFNNIQNNIYFNNNDYLMQKYKDSQNYNYLYYVYQAPETAKYAINLYRHAGNWSGLVYGYSIIEVEQDFDINNYNLYLHDLIQHQYLKTITNGNMSNVFEYSLSQIEESEYYNWATNLGIYTPIYNMVHGLGGHDIIALLLAYWSIYTAIYIVFDIVIACFVKITHLLQSE